jgi:hypothetical protein
MSTYRYVLQGCNDANVESVTKAAARVMGERGLNVDRSSKGYYFISVAAQGDYEGTRAALADALRPLQVTLAIIQEWVPTGFSEFS